MEDLQADNSTDDHILNRVCRHCSVQSSSSGAFCPNCGKSFEKKSSRNAKLLWLGIAGISVAIIAAGSFYVSQQAAAKKVAEEKLAAQVAAASSAAASSSAAVAAAQSKASAESSAAAASADAERALRKIYVGELEASIKKDAKGRVNKGSLDGPIKRVSCTPTGGGSMDDLTSLTTTFECIAVNETNNDGTESGYVFTSTMNWDESTYSWHLGR
ncbi:hypothetical protein ACFY5D_13460 [Paeniglutamicibacter sp. NPDC012692]|uniref:hypothetical protein n=1 Tax=Paeniglutamicibacter sp. NPDC012692 TaxID=3364388 RepID=UPI00367C2C5A